MSQLRSIATLGHLGGLIGLVTLGHLYAGVGADAESLRHAESHYVSRDADSALDGRDAASLEPRTAQSADDARIADSADNGRDMASGEPRIASSAKAGREGATAVTSRHGNSVGWRS